MKYVCVYVLTGELTCKQPCANVPTSIRVKSWASNSRWCLRAACSLRSRTTKGAVCSGNPRLTRAPPSMAVRLMRSCSLLMRRSFSRFCSPSLAVCLLNHLLRVGQYKPIWFYTRVHTTLTPKTYTHTSTLIHLHTHSYT